MPYSRNLQQNQTEEKKYEEKVVQVSRVSKKTQGGNQFGFSILVVVGDKKGKVGVGLGKGKDVLSSIKKAVKKAKKNFINVPMDGTTIPFKVYLKKGAAKVLLKPAPKGSGIIAGGAIRAIVEAAGIRDLSAKILGTNNQASNVYATFAALKHIQHLVALKGIKLKSIVEVEAEEAKKLEQEAAKTKPKPTSTTSGTTNRTAKIPAPKTPPRSRAAAPQPPKPNSKKLPPRPTPSPTPSKPTPASTQTSQKK